MSQPPLTPADCDLTDFAFMPLDVARLFASSFHARATDGEWRAGVTLWAKSWHQVPAASLPDDDVELARLAEFGRDVKSWRKVRAGALRGWIKGDDNLLYHPVVSEKALEAWLEKLAQRLSSGAGNAKRWGIPFDPAPIHQQIDDAARMLAVLDPQSRALTKTARRKSQAAAGGNVGGSPDDTTPGIPSGSQGTETETGTGNLSETDVSGATAPLDPDKKAWTDAVALLVSQGTADKTARSLFGKLLKETGLQARDLLPAIGQAMANSTQDPAGYLRKAAAGIAERKGGLRPGQDSTTGMRPPSAERSEESWRQAVDRWKQDRWWPESMFGPPPNRPGCLCPEHLLPAREAQGARP